MGHDELDVLVFDPCSINLLAIVLLLLLLGLLVLVVVAGVVVAGVVVLSALAGELLGGSSLGASVEVLNLGLAEDAVQGSAPSSKVHPCRHAYM